MIYFASSVGVGGGGDEGVKRRKERAKGVGAALWGGGGGDFGELEGDAGMVDNYAASSPDGCECTQGPDHAPHHLLLALLDTATQHHQQQVNRKFVNALSCCYTQHVKGRQPPGLPYV